VKQSVRKTCLLWSIGAIVLVALFGFGNISNSQSYSSINHGNMFTTPSDKYPGPSDDYAAAPHL
jgi:hypothetical protein